jgi:hypothetical protein
MILLVVVLAGLGAVGWGIAYRARLLCLRYRGVLGALRGYNHRTCTLVNALSAAHDLPEDEK